MQTSKPGAPGECLEVKRGIVVYCRPRSYPGIFPSRADCPLHYAMPDVSLRSTLAASVGGRRWQSPTIKPSLTWALCFLNMNLIFTFFSTVFLGVIVLAAPNPQMDGCVPFPCGPFTCPPADQNDQALISSSTNSTTLTCVYQTLEVPCVYMQSDVSSEWFYMQWYSSQYVGASVLICQGLLHTSCRTKLRLLDVRCRVCAS